MFEITGAVNAAHVHVELLLVDRLAGLGLHVGPHQLRVDQGKILETDFVDRSHIGDHGNHLPLAQRRILGGGNRQPGQSFRHLARRGFAEGGNLFQIVEISGRDSLEFGGDQDIVGLQ